MTDQVEDLFETEKEQDIFKGHIDVADNVFARRTMVRKNRHLPIKIWRVARATGWREGQIRRRTRLKLLEPNSSSQRPAKWRNL